MNAWALAGDPETQAMIPVLLVAEARRFVGNRCNPPLGESGEVRWEDSGVVKALVWVESSGEGKGWPPSAFMFWHLWEAQCCLGAVPFGSVGLDPPLLCPPPPVSSSPSPLWGYRPLSHRWDSCSLGPSWCS